MRTDPCAPRHMWRGRGFWSLFLSLSLWVPNPGHQACTARVSIHWAISLAIFFPSVFGGRVSFRSDSSLTCYVAEAGFEFLILLPLPPKYWLYKSVPLHLVLSSCFPWWYFWALLWETLLASPESSNRHLHHMHILIWMSTYIGTYAYV